MKFISRLFHKMSIQSPKFCMLIFVIILFYLNFDSVVTINVKSRQLIGKLLLIFGVHVEVWVAVGSTTALSKQGY